MDELLRQVIFIARGMWHRRWIGLAVAWIVGLAIAVAILRTPDRYEAYARVYIDTQSILKPLMSGLVVQPNVDQQIGMLSRTLISRPNVQKLIRMADLDHFATTKEEQDRLTDELMHTLTISRAGGDNLYTLAYRDTQPAKAKQVVQSLLSIFVESSLGGKRTDTDSAKKFIEDQIKIYERKLEEAESRLKQFKLEHMDLAGGRDYYGKYTELTAQLAQSRLELREAENSRDALKRQIAGEEPMLLPDDSDPTAPPPAAPQVDARIESLKRNLDTLRLRYTDEHPDVVSTKRVIEELESQRQAELAARRDVPPPKVSPARTNNNSNPVYQQLKVTLAEAEATVASLRSRVAAYEERAAVLKQSARMVPEIEAEYTQLNRDYDIYKKNYESLVSRRESAEISGDMETAAGVADFRLIDPPRVDPHPVSPNRLKLFPFVILGALGAGLLASFLASQLWPTFFDTNSLRQVTLLPVLGTVSFVMSEAYRRKERRGLIGFVTASVALVGAFGASLLVLFMHAVQAA